MLVYRSQKEETYVEAEISTILLSLLLDRVCVVDRIVRADVAAIPGDSAPSVRKPHGEPANREAAAKPCGPSR